MARATTTPASKVTGGCLPSTRRGISVTAFVARQYALMRYFQNLRLDSGTASGFEINHFTRSCIEPGRTTATLNQYWAALSRSSPSPDTPPAQRRSPCWIAKLNAPKLKGLGAFFVAVNDR